MQLFLFISFFFLLIYLPSIGEARKLAINVTELQTHLPSLSERAPHEPSPKKYHMVVSRYLEPVTWLYNGLRTFPEWGASLCQHATDSIELPNDILADVVVDGVPLDWSCYVPLNKGAESSAYLMWIISNWGNFPDWVAFVDASEKSWHQTFRLFPHLKCVKAYLELDPQPAPDYYPLSDADIDSRWHKGLIPGMEVVWNTIIAPHLQAVGLPSEAPVELLTWGSGQFLLSRKAIERLPLGLYTDLYLYTTGQRRWPGDVSWKDNRGFPYTPGGPRDSFVGGAYFLEWVWGRLFELTDITQVKKVC